VSAKKNSSAFQWNMKLSNSNMKIYEKICYAIEISVKTYFYFSIFLYFYKKISLKYNFSTLNEQTLWFYHRNILLVNCSTIQLKYFALIKIFCKLRWSEHYLLNAFCNECEVQYLKNNLRKVLLSTLHYKISHLKSMSAWYKWIPFCALQLHTDIYII